MRKWLDRLENQNTPNKHPTKPTIPKEEPIKGGFVGFVVPYLGGVEKINASEEGTKANPIEPDRGCWPHGVAMNGAEMETFTARLVGFIAKGASESEAERVAEKLVIRDREGDHMGACLECRHLKGLTRWRCNNWKRASVPSDGLARELVATVQHCGGFASVANE